MRICRRCGKEYDNPVPPVTNPKGEITEIMTVEWCPQCNAVGASVLFREKSAYQVMQSDGKLGYFNMPRRLPNEHRT